MKTNGYGTTAELHEKAGQYVLGTLSRAEHQSIDENLPHDDALRNAVEAWEDRLLPLSALADPIAPSARLWRRIERSVGTYQAAQERTVSAVKKHPSHRHAEWNLWNSLSVWRTFGASSFVIAAALAVVLVTRADFVQPVPSFMVVLVAPQDKAPGWVIEASMSRQLSLIPLATTTVPQGKALQFWTKAEGWKGPLSLGLVKPGQPIRIPLDQLPPLQPDQLFELTLEPKTGSPTGKPTGPVQFIGRAVKVS
jgi:anti-sigma-K factor RskA